MTKPTIHGVGIVDKEPESGHARKNDPVYEMWRSMIRRCYGKNTGNLTRTTMCNEWLAFSVFERFATSCSQGKRTLRYKKGAHYSPETCFFVDRQSFLTR